VTGWAIEAATVFAAIFIADFVWARYIGAAAHGRRVEASSWAVAVIVMGGYATIKYVGNPMMLAPAALGAFAGTWTSLWWKGKRENSSS